MEISSLFSESVAERKLVKIPPVCAQPVHEAMQACKAVDNFFHFHSEYVELRENDFSSGDTRASGGQHSAVRMLF